MEHRDESGDESSIYIIWALISYLLVYIAVIPIHIRVTQTTYRIALRYRLINDFVKDYVKEGDFKGNSRSKRRNTSVVPKNRSFLSISNTFLVFF